MSAPQVPNLNSLRRGGGRSRGQGRGAAIGRARGKHGVIPVSKDGIVQNTDNDAATSRLSAVKTGYLDDPFARLLTDSDNVDRRLPLMNRGTYVRTCAIDRLVDDFLSSGQQSTKQIISLGAGSDTRFFRLKQKYPNLPLLYHEFDFPTNTMAKIKQMRTPPFVQIVKELCDFDLSSISAAVSKDEAEDDSMCFHAGQSYYCLHPLDLRTLSKPSRNLDQVEREFSQFVISRDVSTLLLSECCLIYLPPEDADSALSYFTSAFRPSTPVGVIIYEPIRPHDPFGRTMVSNLTARGIHLQTLNAHDSLATQKERLRKHGFGSTKGSEAEGAYAADIDFIWQNWIEETEKERVEHLEWMDEIEEWRLLARHYCVSWGWKADLGQVEKLVFAKWACLPAQDEGG